MRNHTENIQYAYDSAGKIVTADEAVPGELYFCPHCGVPVHVQPSKLGKKFFRTVDHHNHTAPECELISGATASAKARKSREKTNAFRFVNSLLTPPAGCGAVGPVRVTEPALMAGGAALSEGRAYTTLRQVLADGTCFMWPGTRLGDGVIGDIFICVEPLVRHAIEDPFFSGRKIICAGVDKLEGHRKDIIGRHMEEDPIFVFTMYTRGAKYQRKRLIFKCRTEDDVRELQELLYAAVTLKDEEDPEAGKTIYERRYQRVLIAGDWKAISCKKCPLRCSAGEKAKDSCRGALIADLNSFKQVLAIPGESNMSEEKRSDETETGAGENPQTESVTVTRELCDEL